MPRQGRPPRHQRRITTRDYPDLVDAWLRGQRYAALARHYAVHPATIRHHLQRALAQSLPEVLRSVQQRIYELCDLRARLWQRLETDVDTWELIALARGILQLTMAEHELAQALPQPDGDAFRVAGKMPDQIHFEAAQRLARLIREHGLES